MNNPRLALIAVATVLVVGWGVISGVVLPQWDALGQLRQEADLSEQKIERLKELASRKPLIEDAYTSHAGYRSDDPDPLLQRVLLDELEQLTQGQDLQLNLKPKPVQRDGHVSRAAVEIEVDATQDTLLAFLDRLLAWPQLMEVDRLRIATGPSREYPLRASLLIHKVVLRSDAAAAAPSNERQKQSPTPGSLSR